ncbi:inner membrane protein YbhQ [Klebsiella variicola]|uniref:Inner membrane protein YbhQ n=1 Tax=Klebsiella variicola TaxID=244366 RepID=A0A7H4MG75_KLEVA|nr:inner membrane protein YbhQ [Klebsiella variicola]
MRYRLYSRLGLNGGHHHPYFFIKHYTNWLGYILLGGVIFTADLVKLPPHWYISQTTLRIIGGGDADPYALLSVRLRVCQTPSPDD